MVLADNLVILWTALIHILTNCGALSAYHEDCDFHYYCCCKTAVCIGNQLLDFSVPELVRSQSTFGTDPEVLQITVVTFVSMVNN